MRLIENGGRKNTKIIDCAPFPSTDVEKVARISEKSTIEAAIMLGKDTSTEAVFISCTNLRTFNCLDKIANEINKPVFSSNQSLAWHMKELAYQHI